MTLKLIQAARLARFDHRNGWPETFTPEALAQLQCGGARIESRDWREALNLAINTDSIRSTPETVRICTKPARDVVPSLFDLAYGHPDQYTRDGIRYAYTEPAEFKDVTRHHITAHDFAAWLAAQGEEPSQHIAEWFKARGVAAQAGPVPAVEQVVEPEPVQAAPASPLASTKESQAQRQARRYQMCIDAGLEMPVNDYGPWPRGIGAVAKVEGITRQAFKEDVGKHITRLAGKKQA